MKPAILYAADVTIFSPAASMVTAAANLGKVTKTEDQIELALHLCQEVPTFREQLDIDADMLDRLTTFLAVDRRKMTRAAGNGPDRATMKELYRRLDGIGDVWSQIPKVIGEMTSAMGADELLLAIQAKTVKVADVLVGTETSAVVDVLRASSGDPELESSEDLMDVFMARLLEIVAEPKTFPLFDAESSGLLRAVESAQAGRDPVPMQRGGRNRCSSVVHGLSPALLDDANGRDY